jgi:hypothetical protein
MTTATTMTLMKISKIAREVTADAPWAGPITFQLEDGTRFSFDPENGPYVYNGEVIVPIVPDQD